MPPKIITFLSPHEMTSNAISLDLAAASHALLKCYALRADGRLTALAKLGYKIQSKEHVKTFSTLNLAKYAPSHLNMLLPTAASTRTISLQSPPSP